MGDGGGSALSPLQRNSSFQTEALRDAEAEAATHPPTDTLLHAGIPETAHSLSPVCSGMEKPLSPPSPPHNHHLHHPPPGLNLLSSSHHPGVVPSHPSTFLNSPLPLLWILHPPPPNSTRLFSFLVIFFPPPSMFIHDCGSEREISSRALSWPRGPLGL